MSQGGTLSLDEREKAACAWFFITWEAALPFTPGVVERCSLVSRPCGSCPGCSSCVAAVAVTRR